MQKDITGEAAQPIEEPVTITETDSFQNRPIKDPS